MSRIKSWITCWNRLNPFRSKQREQTLFDLHSKERFWRILDRERSRADRTGHELSLVVFGVQNTNAPSNLDEHLAEVLACRIRSTDDVGWFDDQSIGVVLPATPADGAWKFADDICQRISDTTPHMDCRVYTYPSNWLPDDKKYFSQVHLHTASRGLDNAMVQGLRADSSMSGHAASVVLLPSNKLRVSRRRVEGLEPLFVLQLPVWKRCLDIAGAAMGLAIFAPIMLAAAAAIKLTSPGPAIFKQERMGLLGKKFTFLKFRSMCLDNDPEIHKTYVEKLIKNGSQDKCGQGDEPIYKITNDPRVTPVGKFLRKTSIDEIPQLINVLRGEMSLVGPRPPIPYEFWNYDIWHKRRVLDIKPGITGLWQIKGRSRTTFDEMVRLDLKYIREWSLWLDLKVIIQTPLAVFSSKGAY